MGTEFFYDPAAYLQGNFDCRCLPLFCDKYLENKITNSIKVIEESTGAKNPFFTKLQWQNYDLYKKFNDTVFFNSFNLDFFKNRSSSMNLKCQIDFKRKTFINSNLVIDSNIAPNSYFELDMQISEKPFSTDGIYIVSYLVNSDSVVYNLYDSFFDRIRRLNYIIFILYSVMIVLLSIVSFNEFFNNLNHFKDRIIKLNENEILKHINKYNEKKNLLKMKKLMFNNNQDFQEDGSLFYF